MHRRRKRVGGLRGGEDSFCYCCVTGWPMNKYVRFRGSWKQKGFLHQNRGLGVHACIHPCFINFCTFYVLHPTPQAHDNWVKNQKFNEQHIRPVFNSSLAHRARKIIGHQNQPTIIVVARTHTRTHDTGKQVFGVCFTHKLPKTKSVWKSFFFLLFKIHWHSFIVATTTSEQTRRNHGKSVADDNNNRHGPPATATSIHPPYVSTLFFLFCVLK